MGQRGRRPTFSDAAIQFCLSITFLGEGEWKRKKHGAEYRRQWRKVQLGIDAPSLETRAIEVTGNRVGDAPMRPHLLGQIPSDEPVASVSADGADDTKACHEAIAQLGAQAVIPPRKNAKLGFSPCSLRCRRSLDGSPTVGPWHLL